MSILNPKTVGYVPLSYCVARVQADRQDYSDRLTERAMQYAINCFTSLNVMGKQSVEVVYLTMDELGVVDLSTLTDFVDYLKVGIPIKGSVWILNVNPKILPRRGELDATGAGAIFSGDSTFTPSTGYYFADHYLDGNLVNGLFGLSGGFSRSFFSIDYELNRIQFDTAVPNGQIIMEYTSTGIKASGTTTVPRYLVDYIVAFIHDQLNMYDIRVNRFEKREFHMLFIEQENLLRAYKYRFDPNEYLSMCYSTWKQTPKR